MGTARFYKTLFLPGIEGQYLLWKHDYAKLASKVDEIIQLGNLIGCTPLAKDSATRGPNEAIISYVLLWRATFTHWTQLVGPNEIMALNFPDEWTNKNTNRTLRKRWLEKDSPGPYLTAAVNKYRLITHGGLTYGEWVSLGKPSTAAEAAELLNEKYNGTLYQGECYRLNGVPRFDANPIFADPIREVYPSWITAPEACPFDQVHSAGGINTLDGRAALSAPYSLLQYAEDPRYTSFGSSLLIRDARFLSLAPDIPQDTMIRHLPDPWHSYIEKTPVVDLREHLFQKKTPEKTTPAPEEHTS